MKLCTYGMMVVVLMTVLASCGSSKDILYFQGVEDQINVASNELTVKIQSNDNLMIVVTTNTSNQDLVLPYNSINFNRANAQNAEMQGYLVDVAGNIVFPGIGSVHVAGLTKDELSKFIKQELSKDIDEPEVSVRLLNYKVSILGEVRSPGTYRITDERVSVLAALALAGDLTIYGQRRDILVCRIENGVKKFYHLDITSPDFFNSEVYYLQQNDVVYVQPNKAKVSSADVSPLLGTYLSIASLLIGIASLVINIAR